jgi:hypothetical protein
MLIFHLRTFHWTLSLRFSHQHFYALLYIQAHLIFLDLFTVFTFKEN